MNRRNAIKNLTIVSGSLISLPAWMVSCGISDKNTHTSTFTAAQQRALAAITDTIIPSGSSIGALTVGCDKFLQKLIDDCYEQEVQNNVKKQLLDLDNAAETAHNKWFSECTQKQREELLMQFAQSSDKNQKDFFDLTKSQTIRGFNTSQKVMEEYLGYKVAPGHYYGCVPV